MMINGHEETEMGWNVERFKQYFTEDNILKWLEDYRDLGPLPGILLPMLESFFPILPLFLFVAANGAAYGFWFGVLYSWIGTVSGSVIVYFIVRGLAQKPFVRFITKYRKVRSILNWIERRGFGPLFLIYCFPFTPAGLINVVAGLSQIPPRTFTLAVSLGKLVMIFMFTYIGHDFLEIVQEPVKMIIVVSAIFLLWLVGKRLETRMKRTPHKQQPE
jgi:uncharacterized membrane protein YdjX (TVP38/TMEM64 family)